MSGSELDLLDKHVREIKNGTSPDKYLFLSKSEWLYVMLAANRFEELGETVTYALYRIGREWREELVERHSQG